jgi:hypothetical protein
MAVTRNPSPAIQQQAGSIHHLEVVSRAMGPMSKDTTTAKSPLTIAVAPAAKAE